jgi:hypothetical protein
MIFPEPGAFRVKHISVTYFGFGGRIENLQERQIARGMVASSGKKLESLRALEALYRDYHFFFGVSRVKLVSHIISHIILETTCRHCFFSVSTAPNAMCEMY